MWLTETHGATLTREAGNVVGSNEGLLQAKKKTPKKTFHLCESRMRTNIQQTNSSKYYPQSTHNQIFRSYFTVGDDLEM